MTANRSSRPTAATDFLWRSGACASDSPTAARFAWSMSSRDWGRYEAGDGNRTYVSHPPGPWRTRAGLGRPFSARKAREVLPGIFAAAAAAKMFKPRGRPKSGKAHPDLAAAATRDARASESHRPWLADPNGGSADQGNLTLRLRLSPRPAHHSQERSSARLQLPPAGGHLRNP
jgi:hypothetical protein